ncbi:predicted protein [Nematostella vectensis]|uniref:Uncharacterized protein n=1 Tax=Nematostella vectensis TaxID=45351 RepID=A7SER3_NEMVE|nr:uncharacterized protein LOC5509286 [Nematostella vectensis]EDO37748.1 predicted protein [Nematostella vectensis]|eukprot:XP_001629811.1 predicted protein [Nematostella vectensis]
MDYDSEQNSVIGLGNSTSSINSLKDVRRYEKRTLACPSGCGIHLHLNEIPSHDCIRDLKQKVQGMEENLAELESRVAEMLAIEAYYKDKLTTQEGKMEEMTIEIKDLVLERSRRDEIFSSKETFYKEQNAALKEQVAKLEKRMHGLPRRPSNERVNEDEYEAVQRVERDWAIRYDKLLAEKIALETLFHRKEREFAQEIAVMKEEVKALRDSLRLERDVMALEYDQANFDKLQELIDQLEDVVKRKKEAVYGMEHDYNQTDEDYISEDLEDMKILNNNNVIKHGFNTSTMGSSELEITNSA